MHARVLNAAIIGLAGPALTFDETDLLARLPPVGVILFARNVLDTVQLKALTDSIRAVVPEAQVLIDQEGGRVARLRPPHWRAHPAAGALPGIRAAWLTGALIGAECAAVGIDVVCAPVLDILTLGADAVVGDRSYGDAARVIALGRAMADGLLAAGVQPVAKHAPGHGRAGVDSHQALPTVPGDIEADLAPFRVLHDLPWMMTAHVLYPDIDGTRPGTLSPDVVQGVIRNRIGFQGVLVTDDLVMGALTGSMADRAAGAISAGCDVALHCNGVLAESEAVLRAVGPVSALAEARLAAGRALAHARRSALDVAALAAERDGLLS